MIAKCGPILLASLGLASMTSPVLGQGNTFNPYGNSGYADYREFGTPMYSNNAALPGQALLNNSPDGRPAPGEHVPKLCRRTGRGRLALDRRPARCGRATCRISRPISG